MKKYAPKRTEVSTFFIGLIIGILLYINSSSWGIISVIAPIWLIIELYIYISNKNKEDFEKRLSDAKDINKINH